MNTSIGSLFDQFVPELHLHITSLNTERSSVLFERQLPIELRRRCRALAERRNCEFENLFGRARLDIIPTCGATILKLGKGRSKLAVAGIARHRFQELVVWHQLTLAQRDLFSLKTCEAQNVLPAKPPELPWLATLMSPLTFQEGSETSEQIETLLWAIAMSVLRTTACDAFRN